jgi:hypothetical protein
MPKPLAEVEEAALRCLCGAGNLPPWDAAAIRRKAKCFSLSEALTCGLSDWPSLLPRGRFTAPARARTSGARAYDQRAERS